MTIKKLSEPVKEIDLKEDAVYIIKNGEMRKLKAPATGFGTQRVIWQHGIPVRVELTESELM